ncbi:MAG TPA: hypothetical protein VGT60_09825 [Candidatus Limnocylindria bacterium]|nr:hypothetical protein [Candidatus Limnocylindria bacterium]
MPELRLTDAQVAAALADCGPRIAWPATPDVRARVVARIEAEPRRTHWWTNIRSPRYGFAPAIVTIAITLLAVLAFSPEARTTATEILRLRGIEIFRGPVPTPSPTPSRSPGAIRTPVPTIDQVTLGEMVTLAAAEKRAGFRVLVPTDPALGTADAVYVRAVEGSTAISFAYGARPGIPISPQLGLSALVTEFGGRLEPAVLGKVVPSGTTLELLTVNGAPGAWLEGRPHQVFYTSTGRASFVVDTLRLAGNTLIWEQNGLVMRVEAQVDKATALRIAATFR